MAELLLGCGSSKVKKLVMGGRSEWSALTTLDYNKDHNPDIVHDLNDPHLPFFANDSFEEIHVYEVLEHVGTQGDYKFFFAQFEEFWRILKPDGYLIGTVPLPESVWAYGDPSHTRILPMQSFVFLSQAEYAKQIGKTAMSDFRHIYKADFEAVHLFKEDDVLQFVLKAIKPSRIHDRAGA